MIGIDGGSAGADPSDEAPSGLWLTPAELPAGTAVAFSDAWEASRPEVSLVTATLGDPRAIRELVLTLNAEWESGVVFEFLLMDKDSAARSLNELREHARFPWLYVCYPSASQANVRRNLGLRLARAPMIAYPNDDDRYTGTTLLSLRSLVEEHPDAAGFCGRMVDTKGAPAILRWPKRPTQVTRWNNHRTAFGPGTYLRRETIEAIGLFPLDLGLGGESWHWAGDDTDIALRAAAHGKVIFDPRIVLIDSDTSVPEISRRLRYGGGGGEAWRRAGLPWAYVAYLVFRKLAATWLNLLRRDRPAARGHAAWARGVLFGFRGDVPVEFATGDETGTRRLRFHRLLVPTCLVIACLSLLVAADLIVVVHGSLLWELVLLAVATVALFAVVTSPLRWRCDPEEHKKPASLSPTSSDPPIVDQGNVPPGNRRPIFSVITPVVGRTDHLRRLFVSLQREIESGIDLEWIIVDHDPNMAVLELLHELNPSFCWKYLNDPRSRPCEKRNIGMRHSRGRFVHFIDDDAWYTGTTLVSVQETMDRSKLVGVSGRLVDDLGQPDTLKWSRHSADVGRFNVHRVSIGSTAFFRRETLELTGFFEESIAPHSPGMEGALDDTDLIIRATRVGRVRYLPSIRVVHGDLTGVPTSSRRRRFSYGYAQGEWWRREGYPWWFRSWIAFRGFCDVSGFAVAGRGRLARDDAEWLRGCRLGYRQLPPADHLHVRTVDGQSDAAHHGERQEAKRSISWRLVTAALGVIANLGIALVLARSLTKRDLSDYYVLLTALTVAPMAGRFGAGPAATQQISAALALGDRDRARAVASRYWTISAVGSCLAGGLFGIAFVTAIPQSHPFLRAILVAGAVAGEVVRLTLSDTAAAFGRPRLAALLGHYPRAVVTFAAVAVAQLLTDLSFERVLWIIILANLLSTVFGASKLWESTDFSGGRHHTMSFHWRALLAVAAIEAITLVVARGDVWLAGSAFDDTAAALYGTASVLATQLDAPAALVGIALAPIASRFIALGEHARLERLVKQVSAALGLFAVACYLMIAAFGGIGLGALFGSSFEDAQPQLLILGAGHIVNAVFAQAFMLVVMSSRSRFLATVAASLTLGFVVLAVIAASTGPMALAWVSSAASALVALAAGWVCFLHTGISVVPDRKAFAEVFSAARRLVSRSSVAVEASGA